MDSSEDGGADGGIWASFNRVLRRKRREAAAARAAKARMEPMATPTRRPKRRLDLADALSSLITATMVPVAVMASAGTAIGTLLRRRTRPPAEPSPRSAAIPAPTEDSAAPRIDRKTIRLAGRRRGPPVVAVVGPAPATIAATPPCRPKLRASTASKNLGLKPR